MNTYLKTLALACALTSFSFASSEININAENILKDKVLTQKITSHRGNYVIDNNIINTIDSFIESANIKIDGSSISENSGLSRTGEPYANKYIEIKAVAILTYLISHDLIKNFPGQDRKQLDRRMSSDEESPAPKTPEEKHTKESLGNNLTDKSKTESIPIKSRNKNRQVWGF